jgi:hypothetical protein
MKGKKKRGDGLYTTIAALSQGFGLLLLAAEPLLQFTCFSKNLLSPYIHVYTSIYPIHTQLGEGMLAA